jgi:hypothetical protein
VSWDWSAGADSGELMEFHVDDEMFETGSDAQQLHSMPRESSSSQEDDTHVHSGGIGDVSDELQYHENSGAAPVSPVTSTAVWSASEQSNAGMLDMSSSSDDGLVHFRSLNDIYQETIEVEYNSEADIEGLLAELEEPTCYSEAASQVEWIDAMNKEVQSIEKNQTWQLVKLPPGQKAIGLKWVFKLKKNSEGEVIKHKARLVAKGYVQREGIDFDEIFAPVVRMDIVRVILALAANYGWWFTT